MGTIETSGGVFFRELGDFLGAGKVEQINLFLEAFELGDGIVGDDVAVFDDQDAVGGFFHFVELMTAHNNGFGAGFFFLHHLDEAVLHQGIETAGGFVEKEDCRIMHKSGDDAEFLFHAFGKTADGAGGVEFEAFDELFFSVAVFGSSQFMHEAEETQAGHFVEKVDFAGDVAEVLLDLGGTEETVEVVDLASAFIGRGEAEETAHGGGFTSAIGT